VTNGSASWSYRYMRLGALFEGYRLRRLEFRLCALCVLCVDKIDALMVR
jgi:hypothetical protein